MALGYQRARCMSATRVHVRCAGSKMEASVIPGLLPRCPPTTRIRPSASAAWPAQKSPDATGTEAKAPPPGCQTRAWLVGSSHPSQSRTSPVCSRVACTATRGQLRTGDHSPSVAPVAEGGPVRKPPSGERVSLPAPSRLSTRKWYAVSGVRPRRVWPCWVTRAPSSAVWAP